MNRGIIAVAFLAAALFMSRDVRAHEGHVHKVMGTVTAKHENHLEVKATTGKSSTITLNAKTKILRGTAKVNIGDIKAGERVVIAATETKGKDGKTTLVATRITLAKK